MGDSVQHILQAQKSIKAADHMLTMTYPTINDPKILLAVTENIFLSLAQGMSALLHHEKEQKRIDQFKDTFKTKFDIIKEKSKQYNVDEHALSVIEEVYDIIIQHKKSPVEFTRDNSFIICSDQFDMKTITQENMKHYLAVGKMFLTNISQRLN